MGEKEGRGHQAPVVGFGAEKLLLVLIQGQAASSQFRCQRGEKALEEGFQ